VKFFDTKYRIIKDGRYYKVQEHRWFDLIYGWWWHVGAAASLDEAKAIIADEKRVRVKEVVYSE
jgi:hypothetical protein